MIAQCPGPEHFPYHGNIGEARLEQLDGPERDPAFRTCDQVRRDGKGILDPVDPAAGVGHAVLLSPVHGAAQGCRFMPDAEQGHDIVEADFGMPGRGQLSHFLSIQMCLWKVNTHMVHEIQCDDRCSAASGRAGNGLLCHRS
ncbi:hypothetical protein ES708_34504 [subsurface metagenome]